MLEAVLPLVIYLILGYLYKTIFYDTSKQLIEFILYFSLPAIVFNKIYPLTIDERVIGLIIMFCIIILINLLIAYLVGKMMRLNKVYLSTFIIMASFGSTSFIGFSYIDAFYGQNYIIYGLIYDIFGTFLILVSIGMMIINWGSNKKNSYLSIFKSIFLFPPLIMFIITIFAKNFHVPNYIISASNTIGLTLVPLAMIAIGMRLELKNIFARFHIVSVAILLKMIVIPILVLIAFKLSYGIEQTWVKVTIIEAAMPPITMAVILAIKGGLDEKIAINTLVLGVILSLVTITIFTSYLA